MTKITLQQFMLFYKDSPDYLYKKLTFYCRSGKFIKPVICTLIALNTVYMALSIIKSNRDLYYGRFLAGFFYFK